MRVVKSCLERSLVLDAKDEWDFYVPTIALATNATVSRAHGYTPFEVKFRTPFYAPFDEDLGKIVFEEGNPD